MAEHFNTVLCIDRKVSSIEEREKIFFTLAKLYAPLFENPNEICIVNYHENTTYCENWAVGERLLKHAISDKELLFVYGKNMEGAKASQASIHIEDSKFRTVFLVSLPKSKAFEHFLNQTTAYIAKLQAFAENLSQRYIVAAGWELECEATSEIEDVLQEYINDLSLCSWIAVPKILMVDWPRSFIKVSESDKTILLNNPNKI
jgi:hypothetical protein